VPKHDGNAYVAFTARQIIQGGDKRPVATIPKHSWVSAISPATVDNPARWSPPASDTHDAAQQSADWSSDRARRHAVEIGIEAHTFMPTRSGEFIDDAESSKNNVR